MIPMLLSMGATAGGQSATLCVGLINADKLDSNFFTYFMSECLRSLIYAIIFAGATYILFLNFNIAYPPIKIAIILAAQIVISTFIGTLTPFIIDKLKFDPSVGSVPIFTVIADIIAIYLILSFGL